MNTVLILEMIKPYIKNKSMSYKDFEGVFSFLSKKEEYEVINFLFSKGIELVDDTNDEEFNILYNENIFKDTFMSNKKVSEKEEIKKNKNEILEVRKEKNIKQSNEILCSLIQNGNRQAIQDLCIKNEKLIIKYAKECSKRFNCLLDINDLKQAGFIGLMKACEKFDVSKGTRFSTYAVYWIKQSILREIMDNGNTIRLPVHVMEKVIQVNKLNNKYISKNIDRDRRIELISKDLDIKKEMVEDYMMFKDYYLKITSLDMPIGDSEEGSLFEILPDKETASVEDLVILNNLKNDIDDFLYCLSEREAKVIRLRFGLDDGINRTLEEVGKEFDVTRERIRQIEKKALKKLSMSRRPIRRNMKRYWEED